jgi:hypothetical protein
LQFAVERKLKIDLSLITLEWWSTNIKTGVSKIKLPCLVCLYDTSSTIKDIIEGHGPGCWCNNNGLWKSKPGWERMQSILDGMELDGSKMTWTWWQQNIKDAHSKLVVKCKCGIESHNSCLYSVVAGHGITCTCKYATQKKLLKWLQTLGNVQREKQGCKNPETGYTLRFDYFMTIDLPLTMMHGIKFAVELDGPHHFGWNPFMKKFCRGTAERDLLKENWMLSQGHSLIRLHQPDVLNDKSDWKQFVLDCLDDIALDGPAKVYTPDIKEYREGLYKELRL